MYLYLYLSIHLSIYLSIYLSIHIYIYMYDIYVCMVFTTEGSLEVAIESWPEWDLNPQPLSSIQML